MLGGIFFSFLVTNSSFRLNMNICILWSSILFSKDFIFLYCIQVIGFRFFDIFYCFISPWICSWFHDVSYMYTIHFFPKIEKVTFTNQSNIFIFYYRLKTKFLADFIKNRKCKKGLKYFARTTFFKKGKLRLVKIQILF